MLYSSSKNSYIKELKKYSLKKYRDINNKFLIDGIHEIMEAYHNNLLEEVLVLEGYDFKIDVKTNYATLEVLDYLKETKSTPKVIGVCHKMKPTKIEGNVLVLDNIQDPGNLGTIIRSCKAFSINNIFVSLNTVDIYNSKVIRASEGMLFSMNIVPVDLKIAINNLKERGYEILGTDVTNGISSKHFKTSKNYALIMGNEGNGVSSEIKSMCDKNIYIPTKIESLNVAISASIILYELEGK